MKIRIISSIFVLLFIPSLAVTSVSPGISPINSTNEISDSNLDRNVDISMVDNVYLSNPNVVNGEVFDIYGLVRNDGDFFVSAYILFTIKNSSWTVDIASQKIDLEPNEDQYVKTSWTGVEGTYEIIIKADPIDYNDDFPENNVKSTIINISQESQTDRTMKEDINTNQVTEELETSKPDGDHPDISIIQNNRINSNFEIKPGDTRSLDLIISSSIISDEYRIIVGGITSEVSVKPNKWILQLTQGQEYELQIDVSTSGTIDIGSNHNVELLLYRLSDPTDIIQKTFSILFVSDYSENFQNSEDQNSGSEEDSSFSYNPQFSLMSLDEVNPPTIGNITLNPANPTISQNITVNADIIDESTIINATLFYSLNGGSSWLNISMIAGAQNNWSGEIITPGYEVNVSYYIQSYDNFTNLASSSQSYFFFDNSSPLFVDITNPGTVSIQDTATITTHITDNIGINNSAVFLFYSYDNSTYFMIQMTQLNGSVWDAYYDVVVPATNNSLIYYFINVTDLSGLTNSSSLMTYTTDSFPVIVSVVTNPLFPQVNSTTTVYVNVTDDIGISIVNLEYFFNGTFANLTMSELAGLYIATIPATIYDTYVNFTISILDSIGHNVTSSNYSYYSDGILPSLGEVLIDDNTPNYQQNVTISTQVTDINEMRNVSLYYSFDGGNNWSSVNMTGSSGIWAPPSIIKDVLVVSHGQTTTYLTRNGYTFDTITATAFSSIGISTLEQYRILILEPNWSNYANLRNGLTIVNQALDNHSLVISIRVGGNGGSQANIDLLGTNYNQVYINAETFLDSNHPFISGIPWAGNTLLTSYFNSWGYTDHGWLSNLPTSQSGYTEILQNTNGISMFEYSYKESQILVDTLTSIDGGWGSGNDIVADNYINYLNYSYYQQKPSYEGIIPAAPADTNVQYYVNATDMANNSFISEKFSYFSDGSIPQFTNVTGNVTISELDSLVINATITDNWGLDNSTATLVYTYDNITYYQTLMTQITGNNTNAIYQAISPATSQSFVYYYIEITDLYGLIGNSGNYSYVVDHLPTLNSQLIIPTYPHVNSSVIINATVSDDYGISSVVLYYNYNSTWDQTSMNLVDGVYQGSIPATINDTNVDYLISITDSFGHQINTTIYNYHSDGFGPVFDSIIHTPSIPNADSPVLIQANITDSSGIQNATLSYSINAGASWTNLSMNFNAGFWETNIPALNQSVEVYYFVTAFDQVNIISISNQTTFNTDIESPQIYNITAVGIISELLIVPINASLIDNFGINTANVLLFYSYDNSSWFSTAMSRITGDNLNGTYTGISPITAQNNVYYYVQAYDLSGRVNTSNVMNYTIDHQPVVTFDKTNPISPSAFKDVYVFANVSDDFGINQVDLYYYYNSTWQQTSMANVSGQYVGTIGAINMDTQVSYYISTVDTIGHIVNTTTLMYHADGLNPIVGNISYLPSFPSSTDNVTVTINITDNQNIKNATLYYTTNGTWIGVNVTAPPPATSIGRDPLSGYYYGTTRTTDYDTGKLTRLSIYVYSSDTDTLYVTLWGFRIDTGIWEQFYYSGSRGTGNLPVSNWVDPIYEQWRIQIYDSEYNDNFYYSYEYDVQSGYGATIPATMTSATLQFYVESFDSAGNKGNSSIFNYFTDADPPSASGVTLLSTASELTGVVINATISDNVAVDPSQIILYYSYDQSTWFNGLMTLNSGNNISGSYGSIIPPTSQPTVYYYINATDVSGLTYQTSIFSYNIDYVPIVNEIIINPLYPDPSISPSIFANVTDDNSLISVDLYYEFNGSSGMLNMIESGGLYETSVPATAIDSIVNLSIIIMDDFGHNITSTGFSYYSDGNAPVFQSITTIPAYPNNLQNVTVVADIDDLNDLRNVTLYYSYDSGDTWTQVNMNGSIGSGPVNTPVADVLLVSHSQDTTYLTRNGFTFNTITEFQFSTITTATLQDYRILILEPDWSNYAYLRSGLAVVDQALDVFSMVVSIRVAGNGGSQADIDFLGTDYDRTITHIAETILLPNHPLISGLPWGGNTILTSYFNSWSSTDHGWFNNLPTSQLGYTEILQNTNGISMFEYTYKNSHILVDTLTSIDGGWGTGNDLVADNYINYLNYLYTTLTSGYIGLIPVAPADTSVEYYIEATDMANNSQNSGIYSYLIDGGAPLISDIGQINTVSQLDSVTINATVTDGLGVDNSSVQLIYSYDNLTYYQSSMSMITGNDTFGVFQGVSPATTQTKVYYYVYAADISGLFSYSGNFSYQVDLLPTIQNITVTPTYLSSTNDIFVVTEVADDFGFTNVTLHYNYNSTWLFKLMSLQASEYQASIPALFVDANLTYYIEIFDTFGHQVTSSQSIRYVDGISPAITDISRNPEYPITNTQVIISSAIDDINPILNSTLFYSINGSSWISINMNQTGVLTVNGRNPPTGNFVSGSTQTVDHDAEGPIKRLSIYVYSSDADTIVVTLWGMRIDTGTWQQFYSAGSLVTGFIPEFNWATPIYDQWRIQMYDSDGNDQFYYSYNYDVQSNSEAQIPGFSQNTNITYYIQAFDASGNFAESANYSYVIDGTSPTVTNITQIGIVSSIDPVNIEAIASDNGGINETAMLLYYSFDNTSWFNVQMTRETGTIQNGSYLGVIPASGSATTVYYQVYVEDLSGFNFTSSVYTYVTIDVSIALQSPAELTVLNGTNLVNFEFLVTPNNSTIEISFDQGGNWINMTYEGGDLFSHTLNTLTVSEGLLDVWLNVTIIPGVSLIRTYTFYVDRSIPQIVNYTNSSILSGSGQTIYVVISDEVITNNMTVMFHYTYDNLTWYETQMVLENQTITLGTFSGVLPPASGDLVVSYYVSVIDELGWSNQSSLINAQIDYKPLIISVNQSVNFVHSDLPLNVSTQVSDDFGILNVTLHYNFDNTNYTMLMNFQNGAYIGTIPATVIDTNVSYYIRVYDSFIQFNESLHFQYYSDGINPIISNIIDSPSNPSMLDTVNVSITILDKNPIKNATLFYTLDNITWLSIDFNSSNIVQIPATFIDVVVDYYVVVSDMANRTSTSAVLSYYTDGLYPTITGITDLEKVSELASPRVNANITDNNELLSATLYYSIDEITWFSQAMIPESSNITGGGFHANIPTITTGLVAYYVNASDLSGLVTSSITRYYVIDTLPEFLFITHFPSEVTLNSSITVAAFINDDYGITGANLHYWINGVLNTKTMNFVAGAYQAVIDPINFNANVDYIVNAYDTIGHSVNSSTTSITVDGLPPSITFIQYPTGNITVAAEVPIEVSVIDNAELNMSGTLLYVSYDNISWIEFPMQLSGGNTTSATFAEIIPETPTNAIYYYVVSFDKVGLSTTTSIMSFYIKNYPDADNDGVADWTEINVYGSDPNSNDTDSDGLLDFDELFTYYTNVTNHDTDNDGMPDGWEVSYSLNPLFNDALFDKDADELSNLGEYQSGTNPQNKDSDADGMQDGWEVSFSLNPLINDANLDPDEDNLSNIGEYDHSTNPKNADTEGDGMHDGWEITHQLDPLLDDSQADPDNDELINVDEFTNGTNPRNKDTDNDGMPDGWEVSNSLNALVNDASLDADDDELTNLNEFDNDTDPQNEDTDTDEMVDGWEVTNKLDPLVNDADLDLDNDGYTNLEEYELNSDPNDPNDPDSGSGNDVGVIILIFLGISIPISVVGIMKRQQIGELIRKYIKK